MTRWKNGVQADMSDYIKRTAAIEIAQSNLNPLSIIKWIKNLPSADVVPVRHGRWDYDPSGAWCSVCGEYSEVESNYCGNCGAKMDGESDG